MELMGNLLDNAFKFAISEIKVTVSRRLDRLRIEIEDDGPGIDPGKSQQIFQRGVRADSSPARASGWRWSPKLCTATAARSWWMSPRSGRPLHPRPALSPSRPTHCACHPAGAVSAPTHPFAKDGIPIQPANRRHKNLPRGPVKQFRLVR